MQNRVPCKSASEPLKSAGKLCGVDLSMLLGILTLGLCWLVGVQYMNLVGPALTPGEIIPYRDYATEPMELAMGARKIGSYHDSILAHGSRFVGQSGFFRVGEAIEEVFSNAGLEVVEQRIETVAPVTSVREFRLLSDAMDSANSASARVEIYPFMPNHAQPVVTSSAGIEGRLLLLTDEVLYGEESFDDVIGVIDAAETDPEDTFGFDWKRYAALGMRALIVTQREGWEQADWGSIAQREKGMVASVPINFVRLAASPNILNHIGARVRLKVRVDFKRIRSRNIIGVVRTGDPKTEALVIVAPYDAISILPDAAPGALSAWRLALLEGLMHGLLPYRASLRRDVFFVSYAGESMAEDGLIEMLRVLQVNSRQLSSVKDGDDDMHAGSSRPSQRNYRRRIEVVQQERTRNDLRGAQIGQLLALFQDPNFLLNAESTAALVSKLSEDTVAFLSEQFRYIIDSELFERSKPLLRARLAFEREGAGDPQSSEFLSYRLARNHYEEASALSGYGLIRFLELDRKAATEIGLRKQMQLRLEELEHYHAIRRRQIGDDSRLGRTIQTL